MSYATLISLTGGLAVVLLFTWLHKSGKISKTLAILLSFLLLFIGNFYYFGMVLPQQQRDERLAAAEQRLASLPVYRTIRTQQPGLYQKLDREFIHALQEGNSEKQALERLRPWLADLLNQRISYASNAQLYDYMSVALEEMKIIRQKNAELCFKYLFPQVEGGVNTADILPQPLIDKEMAVLDSFLLNSHGAEQPVDAASGRAELQVIVRSLYAKWGTALQTLNAPAEAGVDKAKLCDMTIDLYQSVLALPVNHSGEVLRIILDGNAK
ncbi:hypothetical protein Q3V30_06240 [Erwinia pyri]|uniref:Topoisomerase II n=1 Tax=Erwinia pyri TaxID=3062598 RepID=A0AA50HRT5_9GAMM|nr:hypothetical protein [Erwinia sp. DE2]WLS80078.1 hypothetical protein Q3V30_06240 [Erwinia sp. DE2]